MRAPSPSSTTTADVARRAKRPTTLAKSKCALRPHLGPLTLRRHRTAANDPMRAVNQADMNVNLKPTVDGMREGTRATWRKLGELHDNAPDTLSAAIEAARAQEDDGVTTATVLRIALGTAPPDEETPVLPEGVYRTIVIDPPWPMPKIARRVHAEQGSHLNSATMPLEDIAALDVPDKIDPEGTHIYLWVTQKFLPAGLDILAEWDARYECVLTWVKPTGITPYSWMYNAEHVLFARAGRSLDVQRKGLKL